MKKSVKLLLAIIALAVILTAVYHLVNRTPDKALSIEMQAKAVFEEGGCLSCHSKTPQLPVYANWPIIGKVVREDAAQAIRHLDMTPVMEALDNGTPVSEVALSKIELSTMQGTMPMAKYYLVHWGSQLTKAKKEIILNWIVAQRMTHYSSTLQAPALKDEPLRPVDDSLPVNRAKVILGEMLYNDTRLSSDNTVACSSCHNLAGGGVDNKRYSEGVGKQLGGVNAPTVFNAAYNFVQFWDGRAATLAEQAGGPPLNPVEMASTSWDQIIGKLKEDKAFTAQFMAVYPEGYSGGTLTDAIAEYEKTLITPNARFDRYLKGDSTALSAEEMKGYELFKQNRCATCHTGQNVGGQSYELMSLYGDYFADRGDKLTDGDQGRYAQTKDQYDMHRFKVPGLRNVELTAPYFHDGTIGTLKEAVAKMGTYQSGTTLNEEQLNAITAFLGSLTGTLHGQPLKK